MRKRTGDTKVKLKMKNILMHLLLVALMLAMLVGSYASLLHNIYDFKDTFVTHYTLDSSPLDSSLDSSPPLDYSRLHCARFETGDNAGFCHCYSPQGERLNVPADICNSRVGQIQKQSDNMEILRRRWN